MSCNTKTSLAAVIDAVNAQLNNNYVDRDDPRINQGVFTEPTIRGGLMLDEAAKLDFCGYVQECGLEAPFGKQWINRPLYPDNVLVSVDEEGEIKSQWKPFNEIEARDSELRDDILTNGLVTDAVIAATGGVSQQLINKGLSSIAELMDIPAPIQGMRVYVNSYHEDMAMGGGVFVATRKSGLEENKVTIFDSADPQLKWVRVNYSGITLAMAGAIGDGVTDDSTAIIAALKCGGKVFGRPGGVYLVSQVVLSSDPAVTTNWPNSFKSADSLPFDFDGMGCTIKVMPFINETPPPQVAAALRGATASESIGGAFFIGGLSGFKLTNFTLIAPLFDNPDEDSKPYIEGQQGTVYAYNTRVKGLELYDCDDFKVSSLALTTAYVALAIHSSSSGKISQVHIRNVERGFVAELTSDIEFLECTVDSARYRLAQTNEGTSRRELPVVDSSGTEIYRVVPGATGNDGAKGGSGMSFLTFGCVNTKYIRCESHYARSNCFRVQDLDGTPSSGTEYIDCLSNYCTRHAFSIYGPVTGRVKIVRPVVKNHAELRQIIDPPATREEALLGTQGTDIKDYWVFHSIVDEQHVGFLSGHDGMEIYDLNYETKESISYTRDRYATKPPTRMTRRVGLDNTTVDGDIYKGGEIKIAAYNNESVLALRGKVEGVTAEIYDHADGGFILFQNTTKTSAIEFSDCNFSILGSTSGIVTLLRVPTGTHALAASAGEPDWIFNRVRLSVGENKTQVYAVNMVETDGEDISCVFSDCDLPKGAGIRTDGGTKAIQVLNLNSRNLISPAQSGSSRSSNFRKIYQVDGWDKLWIRVYLDDTYSAYTYVPKFARLESVVPADSNLFTFSASAPSDYLEVLEPYLPVSVAEGPKEIFKTYSRTLVEGTVSFEMSSEEADEGYMQITPTSVVSGHYLLCFSVPPSFDYIAAINDKKI